MVARKSYNHISNSIHLYLADCIDMARLMKMQMMKWDAKVENTVSMTFEVNLGMLNSKTVDQKQYV